MKIAVHGPHRRVGVVHDSTVIDINAAYAKYLAETSAAARPQVDADLVVPAVLGDFIAEGARALDGARAALEHLRHSADDHGISGVPVRTDLDGVVLHPPVPPTARILCALANFADHMASAASNSSGADTKATINRLVSGGPKFFVKDTRAVSGHGEPVRYPARTRRLDYEAEAAAVIGRTGRDIAPEDVVDHIWGYTLFNDWSVRDNVSFGPDFAYSKNFDTSATVGPWIVVAEDIDPQDIPLVCRVNGQVRQDGNTASMIHDFGSLGAHLSRDTTLYPGDLIASGTPKGTAVDSSQQGEDGSFPGDLFINPGDVVEVSSPLIGTLRNTVVSSTEKEHSA